MSYPSGERAPGAGPGAADIRGRGPEGPDLGSREALIRAGERLYGERGIAAVSIREIATAAGQGNTSAVRYHFGSRDGLVDAIFAYRMARIDERRRALLAELGPLGPADDVGLRLLVEALVVPLAESMGHQEAASWYMRFLRQVAFGGDVDVLGAPLAEVTGGLRAVVDGITRHLVHLPPALAAERTVRATELVVHALADHEALVSAGRAWVTTSLLVADLVDTAVAVLEAVPSSATVEALARMERSGGAEVVRNRQQGDDEPRGDRS